MRTLAVILTVTLLVACGSSARLEDKGTGGKAAKAGTTGALGGLVYGLVMHDDDALRQAAAAGAATATVVAANDAMSGPTQGDQQQAEWEAKLGKANSDAIVLLIQRDYAGARAKLAESAASDDPIHAGASKLLTAVLLSDTGDAAAVDAMLPDLIGITDKLSTEAQVRAKLDEAIAELAKLRKRYAD